MATVRFKFKKGELEHGIRVGLDGIVRDDIARRARNVKARAKANIQHMAEEPTGKLGGSIRYVIIKTPLGYSAQVGSDLPESEWFHNGTGIYGPHGTPIVPVSNKFMRFQPHRGSAFVFARRVRGQPGKPFLREAMAAVSP